MTYLLQPKAPKPSARRNAFRAVIIIATVTLLLSFIAPQALPKVFGVIVSPLWQGRTAILNSLSSIRIFSTRNNLLSENRTLREENEVLKLNELKFLLLSEENKELRQLLGNSEVAEGKAAAVILHPSQTYYDIFIVHKTTGTSVGNLAVRSPVVFGKVVEDLGSSLKILLYSSPGNKTEGRLVQGGSPIILEGRGGGNFTAVVPRDLPVSVGNLVSLPSNQSLVMAKIEGIDETETDSFKLIRATVPTNIFSIQWLELIENE